MENENKVIPICRKCNFEHHSYCYHPEASITDFINGSKECIKLNYAGQCKLYRLPMPKEAPKAPVGSIAVDLTLNTEPFKKKMAELLAGL